MYTLKVEVDEVDELKRILNYDNAYSVLWEIAHHLFRPARKHGYQDKEIARCIEECGGKGEELIGILEDRFYEMLEQHRISLD